MTSLKHLWRTFIFIVVSSIFTASAILYFEWLNIKNELTNELIYTNNIINISVQAVMKKNEAILQVFGQRLVELGALEHSSKATTELTKNLLKSNPDLVGIGLANPQGQLVLTSFNFNIERNKLPNLLSNPKTAQTFKQSLQTDAMVIGHTYFMQALKKWVIPMRYRITDSDGHVTAVMTTGISLDTAKMLWSNKSLPSHMNALIVRKDLYTQFSPNGTNENDNLDQIYSEPATTKRINIFTKDLHEQTGLDLESMQVYGKTVALFTMSKTINKKVYTSFSYNPLYQHYTFILTPLSTLYDKLFHASALLLGVLLAFNATLYWVFRSNIKLQAKTEQVLKAQATHDQLTGLPNRRYLLKQFSHWQNEHRGNIAVLFIDLNNFKAINDLNGHTIGDKILKEVSSRIDTFFSNDITIRHGGDEFIILCSETDIDTLNNLSLQCLEELKTPIIVTQIEFNISASIGIAIAPKDGDDVETLLRKADMAMYEAKNKQLGVYIFSTQLETHQKRVSLIESELSNALENKEFHLVYQPQINAIDNSIIGVETLIRWENPKLGNVPPDEFIAIAESSNLIIDIGFYVLETAVKEISDICTTLNRLENVRLSINVSVRQLLSSGFYQQLIEIQDMPHCSNLNLVIEITENLFIEDLEKAKLVLDQIKNLGMEISLDDFGTGYSSLSVLSKLPISELKIDKSFVNDIMTDEQDKQLILSIINLSKSLNIPVLAEGVETVDQAKFLMHNGCDLFQGYYFSRPLVNDKLIEFIKHSQ